MNTKEDFIAVFDSGVGGISVLRHLRRVMPGERYLYIGASAYAPYGTNTKDEVEALTFAAARRLMAWPTRLRAMYSQFSFRSVS